MMPQRCSSELTCATSQGSAAQAFLDRMHEDEQESVVKEIASYATAHVLDRYRDRLEEFWTPDAIEAIENEHRSLFKMYREDGALRDVACSRHVIRMHEIASLGSNLYVPFVAA